MCQANAKAQLKYPGSYHRLQIDTADSRPMTLAQFLKETDRELVERYPGQAGPDLNGRKLSLRTVTLTYKAEDMFGYRSQDTIRCYFRLIDGKPETNAALANHAKARAALEDARRAYELDRFEGRPHPKPKPPELPPFDCCL